MKRHVLAAVVVVTVLLLGYETSGQGRVSGRLLATDGEGVSDCLVQDDMRLGFWFSGGFDSLGYMTGTDGRFSLPVGRGLNRLTFDCPGEGPAARTTVVVWRHYEPEVRVVHTEP